MFIDKAIAGQDKVEKELKDTSQILDRCISNVSYSSPKTSSGKIVLSCIVAAALGLGLFVVTGSAIVVVRNGDSPVFAQPE